jgi:hypothetical protein
LIPPFEANDEPYHLEYINHIVKNSSLPNQLNEKEKIRIEGHQFPLYYIVSALLIKAVWGNSTVDFSLIYNKKHFSAGGPENLVPVFNHVNNNPFTDSKSKTQFYFLRLLSALFALVNLFFVYKTAKLFFLNRKLVNLSLFFAASIPQFIYASSTITNDSVANLFASASIYFFLIFIKTPSLKKIILFSLVFSLCLLCKKTLFFLIPSVIISSAYAMYIGRINRDVFIKLSISLLFFTIVVAGWFYCRNYLLYNDILLTDIEKITVPMHYDPKSIFSFYFIFPFISGLFGSFFGVFGWMNVAMPFFVYVFYFFLFAVCAIGILQKISVKNFTPQKIFVVCSLIICFAGIIYYNLSYTQHQGRFLFPVLSLISFCTITGLKNFFTLIKRDISARNIQRVIYICFVIVNLISVFILYRFYYIENNYL